MKRLKKIMSSLVYLLNSIRYKKNDEYYMNKFIIVGIQSTLDLVEFENNINIGKGNYIYKSKIGRFTYTARNTSIMMSSIGRFCSIGKNVSIGTGDHPINLISSSPLFYSPNNPFNYKMVDGSYFDELKNTI